MYKNRPTMYGKAMKAIQPHMPKIGEPFDRSFYEFLTKQSQFKNNVIDEGYILRSPVVLRNGDNNYRFPIKVTDQSDPNSSGLQQNDVFYVTKIGFYLSKRIYTDATKTSINQNSLPFVWPNPNYFGAAASMTNLYTSGALTLKIGTTQFRESMPLKKFLKVPTVQLGTAVSEVDPEGILVADAYNDVETVLERVPAIAFVGTDSIDLQVNIKNIAQTGLQNGPDAANEDNIMTIEYYGFLIKDGADIVKMTR